ncbi:hypothetical protein ACHAXT_005407 [Thalassiosira profunda]
MGYSARDSGELKLFAEEKKEDGGARDELRDRVDDSAKRSTDTEQGVEASAAGNPEDSGHDAAAHEPSDMVLQDIEEQAPSIQARSQDVSVLPAPSIGEAAALQQMKAGLAAQQLQTQIMTSSLGSMQLGAPVPIVPPALAGPVSLGAVPVPSAAAAQIQQQVLAQQQAAAHAAVLAIGAVTSSQAVAPVGVPPAALFAPGAQIAPTISPALIQQAVHPTAPQSVAPALAALNPIAAADPVAVAPLLAANPLAAITAAGALNPTNATPSVAPTAFIGPQPATATAAAHQLSPQMTIPHYVPPIPATWGAQIPTLSVQDRPLVPPIYNGINPNYPGAQLIHAHPPIFAVNNFLSPAECDFLIEAAHDALGPAPVVGKGSGEVSPSRTSSTCYLAREDLPEYLRKVSLLTGKPAEHCELPQVGRYLPSQQYLQHFDAFDLSNDDGRRFAANGGQRTVTVLVYLNDVSRGGSTAFPNLNVEVRPRRGMALVFFPSTLDGLLDRMALHAALPAVDIKYVSQVWIRQGNYEGRPSKRLAAPMVAGLQERREAAQRLLLAQMSPQQVAAAQAHPQQIAPHQAMIGDIAAQQLLAAQARQMSEHHAAAAQQLQQLQENHAAAAAQQVQMQQQQQGYQQMS